MSILQQSSNIFPILTIGVTPYPTSILSEFQNNPIRDPYGRAIQRAARVLADLVARDAGDAAAAAGPPDHGVQYNTIQYIHIAKLAMLAAVQDNHRVPRAPPVQYIQNTGQEREKRVREGKGEEEGGKCARGAACASACSV